MGRPAKPRSPAWPRPVLFFGMLVLAKVTVLTKWTVVLAKMTGPLTLASLLGGSLNARVEHRRASMLLVLVSWFIVLLVENCRIPFDDPNTHLEVDHDSRGDGAGPQRSGRSRMILIARRQVLFIFSAMVVRLAVSPANAVLVAGLGAVPDRRLRFGRCRGDRRVVRRGCEWSLFRISCCGPRVLSGFVWFCC